MDERRSLLGGRNAANSNLSLTFAIFCIVDLFGVFPVIALPKAVIDCGVYGVPIVLFVFGVQIYAAIVLGRCWIIAQDIDATIVAKKRYPYAAVAELTYGTAMSNLVTILLDATIFGGGIPNLLVASQNLQLFGSRMSSHQFDLSFCWWLIIIGILLCPVMWLGSPKDMKSISILSMLLVSVVTVMTCYCIAVSDDGPVSIVDTPSLQTVLVAYGIIAFQFDIHPMLMTIQVDMKDGTKISLAVIGGFLSIITFMIARVWIILVPFTGVMFATTTVLAAYRFGANVQSNILEGLPASVPLYLIVLLVTFQLCLSSAVGNSALFQHLEDKFKIPRAFNTRRCLMRSGVVALGVILGEVVPRFDLVMSLIGSSLTGPLMFIFPPLFYRRLLSMADSDRRQCMESTMSLLVIAFGVLVTAASTYYSWSDVVRYARFEPSCLLNLTTRAWS